MDKLLEICDEMASGDEFVKLRGIIERYYGHKIAKVDNDGEYKRLKRHLNRYSHIIDYQNGHNFRDGFRYKKGCEYYFSNEEEKNALKNLEGDEKRLYLTGGLEILFEGKTSPEHMIELECAPDLKNKELVKELIKYVGRRVISFRYQPGYHNKEMKVVIHPHLLKEYNSRWFLFGYVHQQDDSWEIVNIALDRIIYRQNVRNIWPHTDIAFKKVPKKFYHDYFKDIVGVTKYEEKSVEEIVIRTVDFKVHQLVRTKRIHSSQVEVMKFDQEKGYGEFSIKVIPNVELQARLLGYGPGLYVVSGSTFFQIIKDAVSQMEKLYSSER